MDKHDADIIHFIFKYEEHHKLFVVYYYPRSRNREHINSQGSVIMKHQEVVAQFMLIINDKNMKNMVSTIVQIDSKKHKIPFFKSLIYARIK